MMINRLRLSFIVTDTVLDAAKLYDAPLAALTSDFGFADRIDKLQNGVPIELGLQLPWPRPSGQMFWERYLHSLPPKRATGKLCCEKLVPLRLPPSSWKLQLNLMTGGQPVDARASLEGFFYPFGTALIISVTLQGDFTVVQAGDLAQEVRHSKVFKAPDEISASGEFLSLAQLLEAARDNLVQTCFGASATSKRGEMFSVATVLSGSGFDHSVPVQAQSDAHRFINGLTHWIKNWHDIAAPPSKIGENRLKTRSKTTNRGDVFASSKHGMTVWFPLRFSQNKPGVHSLACYHRNLTLASMQTGSLLMLAGEVNNAFNSPSPVPASVQKTGRLAAGLLGRLVGGVDTYRTYGTAAQILQSPTFEATNRLRKRFNMSELVAEPAR